MKGLIRSLGENDQVIYVDDGSRDDSADIVSKFDDSRVIVVRSPVNVGRGPIRNRGVEAAHGEVIMFVDADVVVHPETISQVRQEFEDPRMQVLFGSYDEHPGVKGIVGKYRNLLHHFTHQTSGETASHFWTGLGAIRKSVFVEIGGYNEDRWSRNMEEVEFGHRLTEAGHTVWVRPDIQGRHLKPFTVKSMVRTDIYSRAIPWTRLMLSDHRIDNFVLSPTHGVSAIGVLLLVVSPLLLFFDPWIAGAVALGGAAIFLFVNWRLWKFFITRRSRRFTISAVFLHVLHTLSAISGFVIGVWLHAVDSLKRSRGARRSASTGASHGTPEERGSLASSEIEGSESLSRS